MVLKAELRLQRKICFLLMMCLGEINYSGALVSPLS